jgi:hypothetical protein
MDFEDAAQRLKRDQKKLRGRPDLAISQKAKQQAEYQRKQRVRLQQQREQQRRLADYQQRYMHSCDRALHVQSLSSSNGNGFQATSIHGAGDKITLPPSLLQVLTNDMEGRNNVGNPWTFRIGILDPEYTFPMSPLIQTLKPPPMDEDDYSMQGDDDSDDENDQQQQMAAYMDEMSHKYLSYTHCTVVEFTQEEGYVGIPQPIALALLEDSNNHNMSSNTIPSTRTVDPAQAATTDDKDAMDDDAADNNDTPAASSPQEEQTPGHLAWGAFDIPDLPLEITLVQLPKGRGCTLVPTKEAVQHNFYGLKDVKLVLEQSLIRTRATLSVGDVVSSWHRGTKFDLTVTKLLPSAYHAVTCINTDIEVDIGETEPEATTTNSNAPTTTAGNKLGTGYTLSSSTSAATTTAAPSSSSSPTETHTSIILVPEPPEDQREGVCVVQVRHSGGHGKRRFDTQKNRVQDLFAFGSSLMGERDVQSFRLVTRFPRRVFSNNDANAILAEAGIQQGQELFMVEDV